MTKKPLIFNSVNELLKMKEDLTKERDDLLVEIVKLREEMSDAQSRISQMEAEQEENQQKLQEVSVVKQPELIPFGNRHCLSAFYIRLHALVQTHSTSVLTQYILDLHSCNRTFKSEATRRSGKTERRISWSES